jgi:hypothetical protein
MAAYHNKIYLVLAALMQGLTRANSLMAFEKPCFTYFTYFTYFTFSAWGSSKIDVTISDY